MKSSNQQQQVLSDEAASLSESQEQRLIEAVEEYCKAVEEGHSAAKEEILQRYADIAPGLAECLEGLEFVQAQAVELSCARKPGNSAHAPLELGVPLGDFRLLREVGRGGMGVVYEAEQFSLCRRVALKVLPFAATMDPRHLQRFQNEARAAASLDHPHIVKVHAVGQERGVHYYAMQFIDGQTLAEFIREQKQGPDALTEKATHPASQPAASDRQTEAYTPDAIAAPKESPGSSPPSSSVGRGDDAPSPLSPKGTGAGGAPSPLAPPGRGAGGEGDAPDTARSLQAKKSTQTSIHGKAYFHNIARIGIEAAEALEHAHSFGIVHRDIKPGNLMLDGNGHLWITDFGLARMGVDSGLTMSGDVLGTLRYMSPEQALAKHGLVDHRTDVYALGATLYELLTLQPAIKGKDREEILNHLTLNEPIAPRKLNRAIPVDLETIVLKAMTKEPERRYASAKEMAEDLRRFLEDKPVQAKRAGFIHKVRKLARRHRGVTWTAIAALAVVLLLVGWIVRDVQYRRDRTERVVSKALDEAWSLLEDKKPYEALSAAKRADGLLAGGNVSSQLWQRVKGTLKDVNMVIAVDEARLAGTAVKDDHFDSSATVKAMEAAFRDYGIDVPALDESEVIRRIRDSAIADELILALDDWAMARLAQAGRKDPKWKRFMGISAQVDTNKWRNELRAALRKGPKDVGRLLARGMPEKIGLPTVALLGRYAGLERLKMIEGILRKKQKQHPGNFCINDALGRLLRSGKPQRPDEAIGFYRAAVGARPTSPGARLNLGYALLDKERVDDAIDEFKIAIALKKDYAGAHSGLGSALTEKGLFDEAIAECRRAIRLKNDSPVAYNNLATALFHKGLLDEAITHWTEAIRLKEDYVNAHSNLGVALWKKGLIDKAIAECTEAVRLDEESANAHNNLSCVLRNKRLFDKAIAEIKEAIRLKPNDADFHNNLGNALLDKGLADQAIAEYKLALNLKGDLAPIHLNLANVLLDRGLVDEATAEYWKAINLKRDYVDAYDTLGGVFRYGVVQTENNRDLPKSKAAEIVRGHIKNLRKLHELASKHLTRSKADRKVLAGIKEKFAAVLTNYATGRQDLQEALKLVQEAIKLAPRPGWGHWCTLGRTYYRLGNYREAISAYNKSLALPAGRNSWNWLILAMAHWKMNDKDEARKCYRLGVWWMGEHEQAVIEEMRRFQVEAAKLLGEDVATAGQEGKAVQDTKDRLDKSIADLKQTVQREPNNSSAHADLARMLATKGRLNEAIAEFSESLRLTKSDPSVHHDLGDALMANGMVDEAIAKYKDAIKLKQDSASAHNNLGMALLSKGLLDEAIAELRIAVNLKKDWVAARFNLGAALRNRGLLEEAIAECKEAIRLDKNCAEAHCNLGHALRDKGQFTEALAALRRGHKLGSKRRNWRYPSARWVQQCEQLAELDERLTAFLAGKGPNPSAQDLVVFAYVCQRYKKHYATSADLYRKAFAADPSAFQKIDPRRYYAACVAVLAGTGQGKNAAKLMQKEKAAWRKQALAWLRVNLDGWKQALAEASPPNVVRSVAALEHWQKDKDFTAVREAALLAKLPASERKEWRNFWSAVQQVLDQAKSRFTETRHSSSLTSKENEQVHELEATAGKVYVIDLESKQFDAYLRLEDDKGKKLRENDDIQPGRTLNARIVFTAKRNGVYRIVATAFQHRGTGAYTLTIREFQERKAKQKAAK